jgi:broad specificity phosphatase PhoE
MKPVLPPAGSTFPYQPLASNKHVCSARVVVTITSQSYSARISHVRFAPPIVRDARLRECDYGDLTRRPTSEIEQRRLLHLADPFPNGESYQQVVDRVSGWLSEVMRQFDAGTILMIGHRATFYSLEHLLNRVTLHEAVTSPWTWQPGWTYHLRSSFGPRGFSSGFTTGCY